MRQLSKKSVGKLIPYLNSNYLLRNYMIYYSVDHNSFYGWYMLIIKSNKIIVGAMNSHPIALSDRPLLLITNFFILI